MIGTVHTSRRRRARFPDLARAVRSYLRRPAWKRKDAAASGTETVLVRALCHDMGGALSSLQAALGHLRDDGAAGPELLALAQAQAAHLASMLRTAHATSGAVAAHPAGGRMLH